MPVLKEPTERRSADKLKAAGDAAERQMAFYLRRAFGESPDVFVLNDLRLVEGDDAAQIDHLVIHTAGAVIIESKSVTQKVSVNVRGEWARLWDGHWKGMASPVMQARHQARFLQKYIQKRSTAIRGRLSDMMFKGFSEFDIHIIVAVSNDGIIKRDDPSTAPEAMKADQVVFAVEDVIARQRRAAGIGKLFPKFEELSKALRQAELDELLEVLLKANKPKSDEPSLGAAPEKRDPWGFDAVRAEPQLVVQEPDPPAADPEPPQESVPEEKSQVCCKHCGAAGLHITYGKFGYYWKCPTCDGNTVIDKTAPDGRQGKKLRKQGREFFLVFDDGQEVLFHTNPEAAAEAVS